MKASTQNHNGLNGHSTSPHRWEITKLRRVSNDPSAWRGATAEGCPVHVSYFHGVLRVEVAEPATAQHSGLCWRLLLAVRPDYVEAEIDLLRRRGNPFGEAAPRVDSLAAQRREQQVIADWFILGECKSDRRTKAPRMSFWRLRSVLQARDENLDHLRRAGVAGASVRVVVTAIGEG
jgi:hypothetical protein